MKKKKTEAPISEAEIERRKDYQRRYYQANKEKAKEYQREYGRRFRKKPLPSKVLLEQRQDVKQSFNSSDILHSNPEKVAKIVRLIVLGDVTYTG